MSAWRLVFFEMRQQVKSLTFIVVIFIFAIFITTQMKEMFHYPIENNEDITILENSGSTEYLFVPASEQELRANSILYLQNNLDNASITTEQKEKFKQIIILLKNESFEKVYASFQDDPWISEWLKACRIQYGEKLGSIEEVNLNMHKALGTTGYSPLFFKQYVTYMQLITSLVIFPIFLLLFTRDSRYNMSEIIYAQPIRSTNHIFSRYLGALIPLLFFCYIFGISLNLISLFRFSKAGWDIQYTFFIKDFLIYVCPTMIYLSALIMFLMLLFKKTLAVFPIYVAYLIYNVTPQVYEGGGRLSMLSRAVIRLDGENISLQGIILNRSIYLILSAILILLACRLNDRIKHNVIKAVTI